MKGNKASGLLEQETMSNVSLFNVWSPASQSASKKKSKREITDESSPKRVSETLIFVASFSRNCFLDI